MPQLVILRLALRYIRRRVLQSVLFILGVALGVAVVIAIDIANGSASRAFELSSESITGRATHQLLGSGAGISTEIYRNLRLAGVKLSAPVISDYVQVEGATQLLNLLGVDPFAEAPFRDYLTTVEVIGADNTASFEALNRFMAEARTVLISEGLAQTLGLEAGDSMTLIVGANRVPVEILGVLRPNDNLSAQALENLILTDIASAQEITGLVGRISRIDLILTDEQAQLAESLIPEGTRLISTQSSASALSQMTEAFEINLQALSLLAVVVGVFLIYNTVTFSVVQRRPVIGILRSLGASKRQIFAFIIGEALLLGTIGTILGLVLGIFFGRVAVGLVSQTISDLYFALNVNGLAIPPLSLVKGTILGLVASAGAALLPSFDAMRTPPAGSMRRSSLEEKTAQLIPTISLAALLFMVLGYLLLQIPTRSLIVSFSALFCVIFGGALLTPLVLTSLLGAVQPLTSRLFGVLGRLAPRAIVRSLSRTSIAVAALTIAVSVIIGVSVMIGSFRNTIANWLDNTLAADIYISPPGLNSNQVRVDMEPELASRVAQIEGVAQVATSRLITMNAPDYPDLLPVNLNVIDFDLSNAARRFVWKAVEDSNTALQAGQIMVSEPFAFRRGITPEMNQLRLLTDDGIQSFEVFGVFYDYTTDQGLVLMAREVYNQYWDDPYVSAVAAFVSPEADLNTVVTAIENAVSGDYAVEVQSNRALRQNVFDVFERTFTITIALRLLATLVAFIGILSALMSLQLEHSREYGVMRATGMSPNQLRGFTFLQTGLMGLIAGLLAIPIGLALAYILVYVINVRSFGWTMQFTILPNDVLQAFGVALGAALLAGVYPAYQLARINIGRAVRSE